MRLLPSKKYFFGYLFVRIAKTIAVVVFAIGVIYAVFRYAQASNSADSVRYRPSVALDQHLDRLRESFSRTVRFVSAFNSGAEAAKIAIPKFERSIDSDSGFDQLNTQLGGIDQDRQRMKQLILTRFETLVGQIEEKLRAHAASLRAVTTPSPTVGGSTTPSPTPLATSSPREERETLFSGRLGKGEIDARSATLEAAKSFLTGLEAKAESLDSRKNLFDSVTEIEALKRLLPVSIERLTSPQATPTPYVPPSADSQGTSEARTLAKAEEVANELQQYRKSVREAILSSWALDEFFEEASAIAGAEANKCRSASLIANGIWLAAFGQMGMSLVAGIFLAFLILVMADLTLTLLDTATNTGIMAEATQRKSGGPPQS